VEESGKIILETPVFQEGVYQGEISPRKMWSFYRQYGDLICYGVILASIVIMGLGYSMKRREPSPGKNVTSGKSGP
jgi:apolipoprotein N-acyltransferase